MYAILLENMEDKTHEIVGIFQDLLSAYDYIRDCDLNTGKLRANILEYTDKDTRFPSVPRKEG